MSQPLELLASLVRLMSLIVNLKGHNQLFEGQMSQLTVSSIPRLASKSPEKLHQTFVAELYISSLLPHRLSYNISVFYGEPLEED